MSSTQVTGNQIKDGTITRNDLNIASTGLAVIRKLLATAGIAINTSTGIDSGTGDVTISADLSFLNTKYFAKADAVPQNTVLAGPTSGAGTPTFRALTASDVPAQALSVAINANANSGFDLSISGGNTVNVSAVRYQFPTTSDWTAIPRNTVGYMFDSGTNAPPFGQPFGITAGTYFSFGYSEDYPSCMIAMAANPYDNNGDFLFWKKNYDASGGASTSAWYQAASRTWANANLIQSQYASAQSANLWISGNMRATNHVFSDGTYLQAGPGSTYLLDPFSNAQGLKVGSLVISNTYSDSATGNGLFVKGVSYLVGGTYTNTIYPYSGTSLTIGTSSTSTTMNGQYNIVGNLSVSGGNITVGALASGSDTKAVFASPAGVLTLGDVTSGTYSPSAAVSPTGTATPSGFTFMRVGNIVHVSGRLSVTGQTSGISTISVSLPIASNLSADSDLLGVVSGNGISGSSPNYVNGNAATDSALITFFAGSGTISVYVQFQYQVL